MFGRCSLAGCTWKLKANVHFISSVRMESKLVIKMCLDPWILLIFCSLFSAWILGCRVQEELWTVQSLAGMSCVHFHHGIASSSQLHKKADVSKTSKELLYIWLCMLYTYVYIQKNELKSDLEMLIHLAKRSCKGSFLSEVPGPHSILLRFYY